MKVLDLFSGIGGFSLGLHRAGMETVAFCEIEPYPQAVLRKNFPGVPIYDDVRTVTAERLRTDGIDNVDLVCGGFPCQDISHSGHQKGLEGERSGLWVEMHRILCELRPRYLVVENVANLLVGGADHGWAEFSEIWPRQGMTRNGTAFRLATLEPSTAGTEYGLLLTPTAQMDKAWTFRNPLALIRKNHADGNLQEQLMRLYRRMITSKCAQIMMGYPEKWANLEHTETQ